MLTGNRSAAGGLDGISDFNIRRFFNIAIRNYSKFKWFRRFFFSSNMAYILDGLV